MGAQRAPIISMKPLWCGLWEEHYATGQQGPPSPPMASPPGRTCLRVKGRRFTSGRQGWLWATPTEDPGGIRHSKRWRLSKENARLPAVRYRYRLDAGQDRARAYLDFGAGGAGAAPPPSEPIMELARHWLGPLARSGRAAEGSDPFNLGPGLRSWRYWGSNLRSDTCCGSSDRGACTHGCADAASHAEICAGREGAWRGLSGGRLSLPHFG
jgi:hypothetical protein